MKKQYFFTWLLIAFAHTLIAQNISTQTMESSIYKITGVVTDDEGNSMSNVLVTAGSSGKVYTNGDGRFEFDLTTSPLVTQYTILFTTEGYNHIVRNYHTQMGSAFYSVALSKPCRCDTGDCFTLPKYNFDLATPNLSNADKDFLSIATKKLQNNPECNISFIAGGITKTAIKNMQHRLGNIQSYFEKLGISADRIITEVKQGNETNEIKYTIKKGILF